MFGGWDLSQVSLSTLGDRLKELKDNVEHSIESQLRADRLSHLGEEPGASGSGAGSPGMR